MKAPFWTMERCNALEDLRAIHAVAGGLNHGNQIVEAIQRLEELCAKPEVRDLLRELNANAIAERCRAMADGRLIVHDDGRKLTEEWKDNP